MAIINKKNITARDVIGVLVMVIFVVAGLVRALVFHANVISPAQGLVIPQMVGIGLGTTIQNNERIPTLGFSAEAGGGCDKNSDLKIDKEYIGDKLSITIKGYEYTPGPFGAICPAVMNDSSTSINIYTSWLMPGVTRNISVNLRGQENEYQILHENYKIILTPIKATNVLSRGYGSDPEAEEQKSIEMVLYPADVANMFIKTYPKPPKKDYRPALKELAKAKGFLLAEQAYPGLQLPKGSVPEQVLYVAIGKYPLPDSGQSPFLGQLLDGSGINVYLHRVE